LTTLPIGNYVSFCGRPIG